MTLTTEQQAVKDEWVAVRGSWSDTWESILLLDHVFLASYLKFSTVPWRKNHLDDKTKEFMYIAVDAAATHLYSPGTRIHIATALRLGATPDEIMEVIELTSTLGRDAIELWARAADDLDPKADHTRVAEWIASQTSSATSTGTEETK